MTPLPESTPSLVLGTVILAAGRSTRMGRPKLLLPWGPTSVLGHLLVQWQGLGAAQIAVVLGTGDVGMERELNRLGVASENRIVNEAPERGMFSSIQCAARWSGWSQALTHWAIVLGDQPHLRAATLLSLVRFAAAWSESVCQPARNGRLRHPVVMPRKVFGQLREAKAADLREFLASQEVAGCESDDPGLELDIDRPEDYRRALDLVSNA